MKHLNSTVRVSITSTYNCKQKFKIITAVYICNVITFLSSLGANEILPAPDCT